LTNIVDRITDGRARTDRDCPCGDKFIVMNCIKSWTSMKWSGNPTEGESAGGNSLLASEFETARKFQSERIGLFVNIVCDIFDEISISSGAVH